MVLRAGVRKVADRDVVKADDLDFLGDAHAQVVESFHGPDCQDVGRAEQAVVSVLSEDLADFLQGLAGRNVHGEDAEVPPGHPVPLHHLEKPFLPLPHGDHGVIGAEHGDPLRPFLHEGLRCGVRPEKIVAFHEDHVFIAGILFCPVIHHRRDGAVQELGVDGRPGPHHDEPAHLVVQEGIDDEVFYPLVLFRVAEKELQTDKGQLPFDHLGKRGVELVGNVGNQQADEVGLLLTEAPRDVVLPIAELPHRLHDAVPGFLADVS